MIALTRASALMSSACAARKLSVAPLTSGSVREGKLFPVGAELDELVAVRESGCMICRGRLLRKA